MKTLTQNKTSSRKKIILVSLLAVVLVGVSIYGYRTYQRNLFSDKYADPTNQTSKQAISDNKDNSSELTEGLPKDSSSITSDQVPTNPNLSVAITDTSQIDGLVKATAKTSGNGTCVFLYQPADNGKPITQQVNVSADNTCSVSIPEASFAYLGSWQLNVTYYSNEEKTEVSQNVTIH